MIFERLTMFIPAPVSTKYRFSSSLDPMVILRRLPVMALIRIVTMQATKKQESRHQALYVSMRMRPLHGNVSDNNV